MALNGKDGGLVDVDAIGEVWRARRPVTGVGRGDRLRGHRVSRVLRPFRRPVERAPSPWQRERAEAEQ
jgi:hypothetical protein